MRPRARVWSGVLALLAGIGCQSIAGVEDVSFGGGGSNCSSYCRTVMEACPGDVAVYADQKTCERTCALFKPGNASNPEGNTLACRAQQAEVALQFSSDPKESRSNCAAAGPGGDKQCTTFSDNPDCEGYCTIYMAACKTTKDWGFSNFDQCVSRCAAFPRAESFTVADGDSGDTLACRLHHATLALDDPDNNCASAGQRPVADCAGSGDPDCDDYCLVNRTACTGEYEVYESTRQCLAVCKATRKGDRTEDTGGQDTIGCRAYHSYFALMGQPSPHCSHSGPAGDGVCSDDAENHPNCIAYCRLFKQACEAKFDSAYGGKDDVCVDDCETLDDAHPPGGNLYSIEAARSGNTLKCRTLNVVKALTEPLSPDAPGQCEAALGGSPCD
jgi:hypothetical protein